MYCLSIMFGPGPAGWALFFKTKEAADSAWQHVIDEETISITDDFGHLCCVKRATVHGTMLEDMDQSKLAHIERALHQARTNAETQSRAEADPMIRNAQMKRGPSVISPMHGMR